MMDICFWIRLLDISFVALPVPNVEFICANFRTSAPQNEAGCFVVDFNITHIHSVSWFFEKRFYLAPHVFFLFPCIVTSNNLH